MARRTPDQVRAALAAVLADRASRPAPSRTYNRERDWRRATPAEALASLEAILAGRKTRDAA